MAKRKLIEAVEAYSADLVWHLDRAEYYPLIGWSGAQSESATWWHLPNLKAATKVLLKQLLKDLTLVSKE